MAQYFTDFGDKTTGTGVPSGWTERWNTTGISYEIVDDANVVGGKKLRVQDDGNDGRRLLSWDTIDGDAERQDVEIAMLVLTRESGSGSAFRAIVRASGADGSENGYFASGRTINSPGLQIDKYAPSFTNLGGATAALSTGTWYWVRIRINGSDLKAKRWLEGNSEPSAWDIEVTDSEITGDGWVGIGGFNDVNFDCAAVGVGTAGDTAPTEPVSGGNEVTDTAQITTSTASPSTSTETASATDTAQITVAIASAIQSADTGTATDTPTITSATASTLVAEVGQAVTDTALITAATATPRTATDTGSATDTPEVTTATATTLQATAQGIVTDAAAIVTATATPLTAQSGNTITDTPIITQVGTATLTANETATATDQAAPTSASVTVRTSAETATALDNATIVNASGQPIASIETSTATDNPEVTVATITPLTATILPEVLVTELYGETKIVPVLQGTFSVDALLSGTLQVKPH